MSFYLLDTGIAGYFINDRLGVRQRAKDETQRGHRVGICVPVLGELYFGAENSASRDRALSDLRTALPLLRIWPFTNDAAAEYGRLAAELRRLGRPMGQIDIQIAAIALTLGDCTVVTADSDLAAVPGLHTENWAAPAPPTPCRATKLAARHPSRHNPGVEPEPNTQPQVQSWPKPPPPPRPRTARANSARN